MPVKFIAPNCTKAIFILILVMLAFNLSSCLEKQGISKNEKDSGGPSMGNKKIESEIDMSTLTIGYCTPSLNSPYYNALLKSIQETAEFNGMTFISADGEDNIAKQVAAVEDLITKGVDALLLNPLDPNALIGATQLAQQAGIPVFIIDSSIDPKAEFVTTVQSNNFKNGALVGEWLVEKMGNKKMNIALLSGSAGNPVGLTRKQGLLQGITETQLRSLGYVDLNIEVQRYTNWTYEGGLAAMEDILVSNPNINVVITESDVCVIGAIEAIKRAGKTDEILIAAAADGQKEAIKYIRDTDYYGATALNSPMLIGETAVRYAVQYLNGKQDFEKTSYTPPLLITKRNAADLYNPEALF